LTLRVPPDSWMNRLRLTGGLPGDGFLGLGDLLIDAAQSPPGPVVTVLAVDDLAATEKPLAPHLATLTRNQVRFTGTRSLSRCSPSRPVPSSRHSTSSAPRSR